MKIFISVIVILSILICGFVCNYYFLKKQSDNIIFNLNELEKFVYEKNVQKCKSAYKSLEKSWKKSSKILFVFSNHKDLDDIYKSFLKIKVRINQSDFIGAIEEIQVARYLTKEAPFKEIPTLSNIF